MVRILKVEREGVMAYQEARSTYEQNTLYALHYTHAQHVWTLHSPHHPTDTQCAHTHSTHTHT